VSIIPRLDLKFFDDILCHFKIIASVYSQKSDSIPSCDFVPIN
jgi:hypothetical protein